MFLLIQKDFLFVDFEGEPSRPLTERRIKRSPLKDVAGMLRSFHYAAVTVCFEQLKITPEMKKVLYQWSVYWYRWVSRIFFISYYKKILSQQLIPQELNLSLLLLKSYMLEKVLYEIEYELHHRPDWLIFPCYGLLDLIGKTDDAKGF